MNKVRTSIHMDIIQNSVFCLNNVVRSKQRIKVDFDWLKSCRVREAVI